MSTSQARLAFFLPGLYEGGAERVILNLADGIAARGYPVDLVLARAEGPYMPQVPASVRLIDLKAARVLGSVPALAQYLRQERPVAMLSAMFANLMALWAQRLSGVLDRLLISEHNTLSSVVTNQADMRWKWYPRLAGWFYPWATEIIAVSNGIAEDLARTTTIPRERIHVLYNPVVTAELVQKSTEPLQHAWFQPGEPPVIVSVGRLAPQKGFDVLIRAFSVLRQHRPMRLLILGEGDLRPSLEALIHELGLDADVCLQGFVQNPYPYMARASLFVLPSRWEGLPTVLIEALRLGTPIVATDCPGGTREILRNGQYGRMVPVDSPGALADAIAGSLDTPACRPPEESWHTYESGFVVDRYLQLMLGA
ncbi:MAG TPA: glycosyltransferase [Anaerolineales bacterium]|nr:glycosyltransferase [Anaerolineales bacterium]